MILISRFFFHKDYVGLSLWPFIILRDPQLKKDQVLVNHERIHLRQQLELFIIPFLYLLCNRMDDRLVKVQKCLRGL